MTATLVLGGARSGKSRFAQQHALTSARTVTFLATAVAGDEEMRQRIEHHRNDRPAHWVLVEEPLEIAARIQAADEDECLLVDCLTLWLSNLMTGSSYDVEEQIQGLADVIRQAQAELLLVSNEVGAGIVPATALAREFRDWQGRLNQQVASMCKNVYLIVAGCPLKIK